ncbi:hypothetical protein HOM50_03195 [bacterium]|jgi:hypothetical protein|nr:hypothetical protein [bacterium]MBT5015382.1 hypothetical protein [bacterium]
MIINFNTLLFLPLLTFMSNMIIPERAHNKTVTVVIHGTKPPARVSRMFQISHKFFYTPPGLCNAQFVNSRYRYGKIVRTLNESDPCRFPTENVFLFGWSGTLSTSERRKAAENLYEELKNLLKHYPQSTKLRIVAHSHGGNVVLNLPFIQKDKSIKVIVDELVLLACPVQQYTAPNLEDPMFKNIIALYSKTDILQIIDLQGLQKENHAQQKHGTLFSKRRFKEQNNLVQCRVRSKKRDLMHIEFVMSNFIQKLSNVLNAVQNQLSLFKDQHPDKNIIELQDLD